MIKDKEPILAEVQRPKILEKGGVLRRNVLKGLAAAPFLFILPTSVAERVRAIGSYTIPGREQIGMGEELPPLRAEVVDPWMLDRRYPVDFLAQQLVVAGVVATVETGTELVLAFITGKNRLSRRTFLRAAFTGGIGMTASGIGLDHGLRVIADKLLKLRGSEEIKNNPLASFMRAVGKVLEAINQTNLSGDALLNFELQDTNKISDDVVEITVPLSFVGATNEEIVGPSYVVITKPKPGHKLILSQPSSLDGSIVAASVEHMVVNTPNCILGKSIIWGWPLEHSDVVRITDDEKEYRHKNLSARYGAAAPYWTLDILNDLKAASVMEAIARGDTNPFYKQDLSFRADDRKKFQQIVCYKITGKIELTDLSNRKQVQQKVLNGEYDWAIQCHLTINSEDVQTITDLQVLEHMLDNADFNKISMNSFISNPETGEVVFVDSPLSIPMNPRQIYQIAKQVADNFNWKRFICIIGDQGGATGTFCRTKEGIHSGINGWVPNVNRTIMDDGKLDHPPELISHTHALSLLMTKK